MDMNNPGLRNSRLMHQAFFAVLMAPVLVVGGAELANVKNIKTDAAVPANASPNLVILWANLQWPPALTNTISVTNQTNSAYGQVWIDGVTSKPGPTTGLVGQLGFGPPGSNPHDNTNWTWVEAKFNVDAGNNDEFVASPSPERVGSFDYLYRYSTTGGKDWLYADLKGPVPRAQVPPGPGKLTVVSSGDTAPPAVPTGLMVLSTTTDATILAWKAVTGDPSLYGYEVLHGMTAGGPYALLGRVTGTAYTNATVRTGDTAYYVVRSIDHSFNRSGNSTEVNSIPEHRTVTVTFNVTVPNSTDSTRRSVHIAGTLDQLDAALPQWDPTSVLLTRVDATHWTMTRTGKEGTQIEYKYAQGSWDYVEKSGTCDETTNRQLTLTYGSDGKQTVNDTVLNWRNAPPCGN